MNGRTIAIGLALAILLVGAIALAEKGDGFAPTGELRILTWPDEAAVAEGAELGPQAPLVFDVESIGADYLYLVQLPEGAPPRVLAPQTGLAWMAKPGVTRVIPQPPSARLEDAPEPAWRSETGGPSEFVLVAAPAPRDVPPDSHITSLDDFCAPIPFLQGPAAGPAVVIARRSVTFSE